MTFIASAHAQDTTPTIEAPTPINAPNAAPPAPGEALAWNIGLIGLLMVMFYVLLIRPQQKRFQAHKDMVDALQKGDKVVAAGGLIGKIDKLNDDEIIVDLGSGTKVTVLRSTIQQKMNQ